jgi:hypothetical protein
MHPLLQFSPSEIPYLSSEFTEISDRLPMGGPVNPTYSNLQMKDSIVFKKVVLPYFKKAR